MLSVRFVNNMTRQGKDEPLRLGLAAGLQPRWYISQLSFQELLTEFGRFEG